MPPRIIPNGAAADAVANAARGSRHSAIIEGIALGSSWLSTPSRMTSRAVPAISSF